MSILAVRGGNVTLVDDGDGMGHVESGGGRGPSMPVDSILKWGYWEPVEAVTAAGAPLEGEIALTLKYRRLYQKLIAGIVRRYRDALTAAGEPNLDQVLNEQVLTDEQRKALKAARDRIAQQAATAQAVQFGISFAVTSPYLEQLVEEHAGKQAERIVAGSREIVARIIQQSFTEGWSVPETAAEIRSKLTEAAKWQSVMLARTDLIGLANAGSFAAAMSLGEQRPVYKRWINADDEKVRPTHVEAQNQVVPTQLPFTVGGAQLQFPGDPHGPDQEVINCRCTLVYLDDPAAVSDHLGRKLTASTTAAAWREEDHPRDPGGEGGGEFIEKGTGDGGPTADDVEAAFREQQIDDASIIKGVRVALEEMPDRLTHGDTGKHGFWLVDGKAYVHNDWRDIPTEARTRAVSVHSHAPDGVTNPSQIEKYFPSEGPGWNDPFSTGDLKLLQDNALKGDAAPRIAVLHGDGTMDIVGYGLDTNMKALHRKSVKTLQREIFGTYEEAAANYEATGEPSVARTRRQLREWMAKNRFDYREGVRWATPEEVRAIRMRHSSESLRAAGWAAEIAAGWDESEHPRHPGGTSEGGKFAPKGEDVFQPTVPGTYDEYLDEVEHVDAAWENWTADTAQMYAGKVPARYSMIAGKNVEPKDAELAKVRVQDGIAAKLEGDEDFKSLIAALDPYGDWKSEFEPGGAMQTAKTTEQQVAALSIATWARTSGDTDPIALQFQIAAEQEFGLAANPFVHQAFEGYRLDSEQNPPDRVFFTDQQMAGARKFLRAQYELTQDLFEREGITEVYAYRGMAWRPTEVPSEIEQLRSGRKGIGVVSVHGNPLSSWSLGFNTAESFSTKYDVRAIAGARIDVRRILSTPFTGFGCLGEEELVVLGGDDMDAMTWAWNNRYLRSSYDPTVRTDDVVRETTGPGSGEEGESTFVHEWITTTTGRERTPRQILLGE